MGFLISFLYSQLLVTLPVPTYDFTNQTVIVTGSNAGLGFEAAHHISRLNASLLILAVRNLSKGHAAKKSILTSTGRPANSIEVWELNMDSYDSIRSFASRVNTLPRLDAILENAGIQSPSFKMVAGYESVITTNVIGTFLLALLILPKLRETAATFKVGPRLSIVGSELHFVAKFSEGAADDIFAALNDEHSAMATERYATSKLIQIFGVRELGSLIANRTKSQSPGVIINCLTPGACKSDFNRNASRITKLMYNTTAPFIARTAEVGGRALIAGIAAGESSNGEYMADCQISHPSPMVLSLQGEQLQKKVWAQLMQQLEKIEPGISQKIEMS